MLLIAAGVYQLTPLKYACLKHCRSPLFFISHHWRPGEWGALRMGVEHGAFCTGCCWFLMALLFYGGIMNLFWIIGLALLRAGREGGAGRPLGRLGYGLEPDRLGRRPAADGSLAQVPPAIRPASV